MFFWWKKIDGYSLPSSFLFHLPFAYSECDHYWCNCWLGCYLFQCVAAARNVQLIDVARFRWLKNLDYGWNWKPSKELTRENGITHKVYKHDPKHTQTRTVVHEQNFGANGIRRALNCISFMFIVHTPLIHILHITQNEINKNQKATTQTHILLQFRSFSSSTSLFLEHWLFSCCFSISKFNKKECRIKPLTLQCNVNML